MLLRMVLLLKQRELEHHIRKHFHESSVSIENLGHFKFPFQKALRSGGDVFIINTDLIPPPIEPSIALLKDLPEKPTAILLEKEESPERHADLLAMGADMVLYSGLSPESISDAIEVKVYAKLDQARILLPSRGGAGARLNSFVGDSPRTKFFLEIAQKVMPCSSPVLILGETGTGKELMARIIHNEGPRAGNPFIAINCAAIPETLLESELFGHEKGAFTGAVRPRKGAFELAHGGTLFLDEIGELPPYMQVKLLRVLQEYEIRPLGSEKTINVDVRIIAATSVNIDDSIKNGRFRKDLYYRLGVFTLEIPPLRERREDIPLIAQHYLIDFSKKLNKNVRSFHEKALEGLINYDWPGNARELINVIERAVILCSGDKIMPDDLPDEIRGQGEQITDPSLLQAACPEWRGKTLREVKEEFLGRIERSYIEYILAESGGRIGKAAGIAGISTRSLYEKMKRLGIDKKTFKTNGQKNA